MKLQISGLKPPSSPVKPKAPDKLTVHNNVSDAWLLTWSNPYPLNNFLYNELMYMVNISRVDHPEEVSGHHGSLPLPGNGAGKEGSIFGVGSLGMVWSRTKELPPHQAPPQARPSPSWSSIFSVQLRWPVFYHYKVLR